MRNTIERIERFADCNLAVTYISAGDYADLAPRLAVRTCVIDRRSTFEVKLRQVLARQKLPELVLITNRCN